jgi:hypothetical protein
MKIMNELHRLLVAHIDAGKSMKGLFGLSMILVFCIAGSVMGSGVGFSEAVVSSGGNTVQGETIIMDAMFGEPLDGVGQGIDNTLRGGAVGQYYQPVVLMAQADSPSVPEVSSFQLSANSVNDDGSYSVLDVAWNILSGPVSSVDVLGVATAEAVYQDTLAFLVAGASGLSATTSVVVADSLRDNFGLYASDGVADLWQVEKFGTSNVLGVASADPDEDGQNNFMEFMAGTSPSDAGDVFRIQGIRRGALGMNLVLEPAFSNRVYHIEACTDLKATNWVQVATSAGPTQTLQLAVSDLTMTSPVMFYRASIDYAW